MTDQTEYVVLPKAAVEELQGTLRNRQELEPESTASNLARLVADRLDALLAAAKPVVDDGIYTVTDTCGEPGPDAEIQVGFDRAEIGNTFRVLLVSADAAEEG